MIETPTIVIQEQKLKRNIENMAKVAKQNHVALRPHVKTHKIPEIARMQIEAGAVGVTVAKTTEAEVMASGGVQDIFIAYPVVTEEKIERVLRLNRNTRIIVGVDSFEGAKRLAEQAEKDGQTVEVRLEIDTGLRRTGVPYDQALDLALEVASLNHLKLTGIYTFRGALYQGQPTMDLEKAGLEEGTRMVALANDMRKIGLNIKEADFSPISLDISYCLFAN